MADQAPDVEIWDLEFDDANRRHFAEGAASGRTYDENTITDVRADDPRMFMNAQSPTRSASHLMIGRDSNGQFWTIPIVYVDEEAHVWRPITGIPSSEKEKRAWHERG